MSSYVLHSSWGIGQGHETYDDFFDYAGLESRALTDVERPAGPVVDAALAWLRQPRRDKRPFYLWVHLYDPHRPYEPPDGLPRKAPTPYAGEVMYADAQVSRLLDALDTLGVRGNTLVVYLSDHGESLGDHGEPTHGIFLYGATLDVPLIIAPPSSGRARLAGRRPRRPARRAAWRASSTSRRQCSTSPGCLCHPVSTASSLLPMVAHEAASANSSPAADPADALAGPVSYAETYYPRFHYNWSELIAVETARWKYVRAPRPELYDLRKDPEGASRRDGRAPGGRGHARQAARLDEPRGKASSEPTPAKIDPEALARLRALGYVGGDDVPRGARGRGRGPIRKTDCRCSRNCCRHRPTVMRAGCDEAAQTPRGADREGSTEPGRLHHAVVGVRPPQGHRREPSGPPNAPFALDPQSAVAVIDLAFAFQSAGRRDEAAAGFERVLSLDPENLKALLNLGEIHHARGDREKAFEFYQRAVAAAPRLARARIGLGSVALELKRLAVAEEALKQAVALGGNQPDLHFNLGVMAEERGQRAVAVREYRAEVAAFPDSLGAWVNLGLLERQAGRVDAALAAFEGAARAKADAFEGPYLLAETLASGRTTPGRPSAGPWRRCGAAPTSRARSSCCSASGGQPDAETTVGASLIRIQPDEHVDHVKDR